jgi:hypothetical protein
MSAPIVISLAALAVSMVGAGFSIYFNLRERAKLMALSQLLEGDEVEEPSIRITAINAGRRPLILRMWGGTDESGNWVGRFLDQEQQGLRLAEHERTDVMLRNSDLGFSHDEVIEFTELWFEDSLGRRYRIKDSRKNIEKFWNAWKTHRAAQERQREMRGLVVREVKAALAAANKSNE